MADLDADRKLVAILCADVAGYSRMIGEDEEGTLAALRANMSELIEPAIARHYGRIVKTTGDGFLAEFGSPIAAALAALEIQDGARSRNADVPEPKQQWLRIGITLGDVLVRDGDLFGDAVNVAARLQSLAEPGSVYTSEAVVDQLRGHIGFAWTDVGEQALKNIVRPVRTYRLAAGASRPSAGARQRRRALRLAIGATAILGLVAAVAYGLLNSFVIPIPSRPASESALSVKPEVAVLPFVNQSGDSANDYFSDGITEDIINALGRFSALSVMTYNATLPYKGKAAQPAEIGRDLGVRYLVEGSVRRADDRVRVSTRLTDARQGTVLWSQEFDAKLEDVFAVRTPSRGVSPGPSPPVSPVSNDNVRSPSRPTISMHTISCCADGHGYGRPHAPAIARRRSSSSRPCSLIPTTRRLMPASALPIWRWRRTVGRSSQERCWRAPSSTLGMHCRTTQAISRRI
jgi:class 3 adenylate cyclase/TolB-like protein